MCPGRNVANRSQSSLKAFISEANQIEPANFNCECQLPSYEVGTNSVPYTIDTFDWK